MAFFVLLSHAAIWTGALPSLRPIFVAGGMAVDVFMLMSGFLMYWHYQQRELREPWAKPNTWKTFWIRRFFRMAPLYWFILLITYAFLPTLTAWTDEFHRIYPPPWAKYLAAPSRVSTHLDFQNALSHFTFIFGFIPKFASNNPLPDWSIGLEMQFYLFFPFIAIGIRKLGWPAIGLLAVLTWQISEDRISVGLLQQEGPWGWFPMATFLPLRLGLFLSGMLAALAVSRIGTGRFPDWSLISCVLCAGLHSKWLAVFVMMFLFWEYISRATRLPELISGPARYGNHLLDSRPIKFFADCSYGVYLWHILIQLAAMRLLEDFGAFSGTQALTRFLILVSIVTPIVYLVAWISYRMIELPGIGIGKRITKKRMSHAPTLAESQEGA